MTSARSIKTLSSELHEHTDLANVDCVRAATQEWWDFYPGFYAPWPQGLVSERHGTDHPTCVTELKSGPVTTTLGA